MKRFQPLLMVGLLVGGIFGAISGSLLFYFFFKSHERGWVKLPVPSEPAVEILSVSMDKKPPHAIDALVKTKTGKLYTCGSSSTTCFPSMLTEGQAADQAGKLMTVCKSRPTKMELSSPPSGNLLDSCQFPVPYTGEILATVILLEDHQLWWLLPASNINTPLVLAMAGLCLGGLAGSLLGLGWAIWRSRTAQRTAAFSELPEIAQPGKSKTILNIIAVVAAWLSIFCGFIFICGAFGEKGKDWWIPLGLVGVGLGLAFLWFALRFQRTATGVKKPAIPQSEERASIVEPGKVRSKYKLAIILILGSISLGIFSCCVLITVAFVQSLGPKTSASWYQDAALEEMIKGCREESYSEPQPWMKPVPGSNVVLELAYSKSLPIPDALYAYNFFLQITPALIETGQVLIIPDEGVSPFLIETHAPFIYCSADLEGRIQILEINDKTLRAWIDASEITQGTAWKYSGEVLFKQAILPYSLP